MVMTERELQEIEAKERTAVSSRIRLELMHTDVPALVAEVRRLQEEVRAWHECATYDPDMSGKPRFLVWSRSALERTRRKYIEEAAE